MLAAHQKQLQQPPGFTLLRVHRTRPLPETPLDVPPKIPNSMQQRRGIDSIIHGVSTLRVGPGLAGEPRQVTCPIPNSLLVFFSPHPHFCRISLQVTPSVFRSTWPGLDVRLRHLNQMSQRRNARARDFLDSVREVDSAPAAAVSLPETRCLLIKAQTQKQHEHALCYYHARSDARTAGLLGENEGR
jgi:hypothetical protein